MPDNPLSSVADIVASYVLANKVEAATLPELIRSVHQALIGLGDGSEPSSAAVSTLKATPSQIRRSIRPEGLVSFEDGKTYQTLKRHLAGRGLTMTAYREKWGLPPDYPSTSPEYSARRSQLAKVAGLGRKVESDPAPAADGAKRPRRRGASNAGQA